MKSSNRNLKILYVGRDDKKRKGFAELLQKAGYSVTAEPVASRTLETLDLDGFHLFVSTRSPFLDGFSSHPGAARPRQKGTRPPAIALTARPGTGGEKARRPVAPAGRVLAQQPVTMSLRALRDSVGKRQRDIARAASMSQPQLSRIEARGDHLMSTLRKYVRALGGEIEVVARIGGRRISLRNA
jgi:CheY-like chemotaxis protein